MQKSADTMDHDGREAAANENCPPQEVSNLWDCEMGKRLGREWEEVAKFLRKSHKNLISIVEETKASKQAKACIELEWSRLVEELGKLHRGRGKNTPEALVTSTSATMAERGIESEEDWKDYVATMERDGEIVSDLSEMLNVNTLQIKDCVADLLRQDADRKVAGMLEPKAQESLSYNHARQDNRPLQESLYLTGPTFAESWRRRSAEEAAPKQEGPGTDVNLQRKYQGVITCEDTLVDILTDDHLAGRAKNVFLSLPGRVKEQGLDAVVAEMTKLLACDSTASRPRALTELKHLRMRPNQDVTEFYVVLEDLSRQVNPQGALEERSLELAQILLDNLSSWPEHFQLIGALHNVEPSRAYEEVKRLALSIEQSKLILAKRREYSLPSWKTRAVQYNCNREPGFGDKEAHYRGSYGHVARDCPGRVAKVNQIEPKEKEPSRDGRSLSSIINEARCMRMNITGKGSEENDLIGKRLTISLKVLGKQCQALVNTGSMISIVPMELLAKAQDKGVDLDSPSMIPKAKLKPVYDASDRRMDFLAAVYLEVELKDGCTQEVAFHISPRKECEVIVGMNALSKLGIKMIIGKDRREENGKGDRGAVLASSKDKGHIQYQCQDNCFAKATLTDIEGIHFPGAYRKKPFGDMWSAWKAASIFIRKELTVPQKIAFFKQGVFSLDEEALRRILKLAYSLCTDWTEFICTTSSVAKHEVIEGNCIIDFYRGAFERLKMDLADESGATRKLRDGPAGFAAPESALLLETDGPKGGLTTKVVTLITA
uniref:Integrase catalytic domain-containing protein n=1 Tax=Haemonchus contortus TaxID=6289 RepID=A0A7I5E7W1_HAECO